MGRPPEELFTTFTRLSAQRKKESRSSLIDPAGLADQIGQLSGVRSRSGNIGLRGNGTNPSTARTDTT
jgi:hypothetical protein